MRLTRSVALCAAVLLGLAWGEARAQRSDNPHGALKDACSACHTAAGWKPARPSRDFRHAEKTFPLEGAHQRTACMSCHKSLDFKQTPATCASCHSDVHQGELGPQCSRCHTTRSFVDEGRMRRIHEMTRFPLRGAHSMAQCSACHTPARPGQAQYANRPTTCVGCHVENYRRTTSPDHKAANFPLDCAFCHGVGGWTGANFNHANTRFPLTGAHVAKPCAACHADGVYRGKPLTCSGCHLANYTATTNPAHAASGFPTTCESCHQTSGWAGAKFDHDGPFFPIYSGKHLNRWTRCADCHNAPATFSVFTCTTSCHVKSVTDSHHTGVSGYSYDSNKCYACHPKGRVG